MCACTMSGCSVRNSRTRSRNARTCASGISRRWNGTPTTRNPSARTLSSSRPSAQTPITSWPRARIPCINGSRNCLSEKSTLVISMIFKAVMRCRGADMRSAMRRRERIAQRLSALPHLADRPFNLLRTIGESGQHHLFAASRFRTAEVDAFLQAHARAIGAQAPATTGAQAQQHRFTILLQAGVDVGVQMEPQGEWLRGWGFHRILAAHVLPAFREVQAPAMHRAEQLLPAVVAGLQPMRAVCFLALHLYHAGATAEALRLQLGGADISDHQRGMRGGGAGRVAPRRIAGGKRTAVHDHPVAAHPK